MINVSRKQKIALAKKYKRTAINALLDKVAYASRKKPSPYPRIINLFVTERCNFACPMCHVKKSRKDYQKKIANELSLEDLKPLIKEAGKYGSAFQIIGGEPLLWKDIIRLIDFLDKNNLPKGLTTNGLLLEKYAEEIVRSGLDFLSISLDGFDEEHQYKRGYVPGSFEKAIRGIQKVKDARGKKLFPNIRIATVVAPMNLDSFEKILDVALDCQADQWSLSHYFFYYDKIKAAQEEFARKYAMGSEVWGDYSESRKSFYTPQEVKMIRHKYDQLLERIKTRQIQDVAISIQKDLDIEKYYQGDSPKVGSICTSPFNQVFIRGNGDVEMCQGYILGNIKKESLKDIWKNEKSQHFRKIFAQNKYLMPSCFRCCAMSKFKF